MKPNIVERLTYEALLSNNNRHFPMAGPIFLPAYKNTFGNKAPRLFTFFLDKKSNPPECTIRYGRAKKSRQIFGFHLFSWKKRWSQKFKPILMRWQLQSELSLCQNRRLKKSSVEHFRRNNLSDDGDGPCWAPCAVGVSLTVLKETSRSKVEKVQETLWTDSIFHPSHFIISFG